MCNALINSTRNITLCVEAKTLKLLRIQLELANQKKFSFGRYQSYKRRNFKKSRVALGTRMAEGTSSHSLLIHVN